MVIALSYLKLSLHNTKPIIGLQWIWGVSEGRWTTLQKLAPSVTDLMELLWGIVLIILYGLCHLLHELRLHHEKLLN
jgi:hypothetical protein